MASNIKFSNDKNIVYAETFAGTNISNTEVDNLQQFVSENVEGPWVFIEIRHKGVSIDPMAYVYANKICPDIIGFALVAESDLTVKTFPVESSFINDMKFSMFRSIDEAKAWASTVLEDGG